jgi:hypothetical protein
MGRARSVRSEAMLGNNPVGAVGHVADGREAPCMLLVDLAFARKRCARHFGFAELGWVGMTLATK